MKRYTTLIILLAVLLAAGAAYWFYDRHAKAASAFETVPVTKGDVQVTITATGTVEPVEVVDVGAQVAGLILAFGVDPHDPSKVVDYDTQVEEGTVLAHIDTSLYQSDVDQFTAELNVAEANVKVAQANLAQYQAKLVQAQNDWDRAQKLGPSEALAKSEYDSFQAAFETAKANVGVGEANVAQTQASIMEADANLKRAQRNLSYCTITSPVKGVVIDRRVNIGQTVVSSLNAPSLFLIAKDLTKMQVWISVNEADIGRIKPNMPVTFTVDAFPDRLFHGVVGKIRLNATMTQNVVTYTVEVTTDNSDNALLPYLTATVQFMVDQRTGVLTIPNAALRWRPHTVDESAAIAASAPGNTTTASPGNTTSNTTAIVAAAGATPGDTQGSGQRSGGRRGNRGANSGQPSKNGTVWVLDHGVPSPVSVRLGLSDEVSTEILSGLSEGQEVITGENTPDSGGGSGTTNPFAPTFLRGGGGGGNRRG